MPSTKISNTLLSKTETPAVIYNMDMFYLFANISSLVDVAWFLGVYKTTSLSIRMSAYIHVGIPFNDTSNWRLAIAEYGESILGDNLLGLQAANEPDLYVEYVLVIANAMVTS